jgi:hypothetical protein
MVTSLDLEDIREEVRTKANMKGLNDAWLLWFSTRKIENSKLLIRLELYELRAKDNPRLFSLVVIYLNGRSERASVCYKSCFISLVSSIKADQFFNHVIQRHLPKVFVGLKHVGLTALGPNATLTVVSHIDSLIGVQRNRSALFKNRYLHRRDIPAGSMDHPSVDCISNSSILLGMSLLGSQ